MRSSPVAINLKSPGALTCAGPVGRPVTLVPGSKDFLSEPFLRTTPVNMFQKGVDIWLRVAVRLAALQSWKEFEGKGSGNKIMFRSARTRFNFEGAPRHGRTMRFGNISETFRLGLTGMIFASKTSSTHLFNFEGALRRRATPHARAKRRQ